MRTVSRSLSQSTPSAAVDGQVLGQVDRAEVAHRGLVVGGDLDDLGAQVGQVHDRAAGEPATGSLVWLQVRLAASLNVIQPLPVCASVRIICP